MTKNEIVRDAVIKFKHLPNRTIARYILYNYGPLFDGDLENIRQRIRKLVGAQGESSRQKKDIITRDTPARMPRTWSRKRTAYDLPPGLWLVLSDLHIPFHDPVAIESAVKYGQANKIEGILFNGDLQDCASISYWPSSIKRDFDMEIASTIDFLDFIKYEFPKIKFVYKPGNHEFRLPRLYQSKVPELIGLPLGAMEEVLGFEGRGIAFLDYKQVVNAGKLPILHGDEYQHLSRAVNPARGLFLKTNSWAACGHCHSTSEHTSVDVRGKYLTTWSFGCLCDLHPEFAPFSNWNHGFALVNVEPNGDFEVENKRVLAGGKVV